MISDDDDNIINDFDSIKTSKIKLFIVGHGKRL